MLPSEVTRDRREAAIDNRRDGAEPTVAPAHQVLFQRLITDGASFWSEVYEPFMARDLTRHEVRELIRLGLEHTRGNYKMLVTSFNMPPEDYKKFLNFLRKYQCHVPFQRFRMMPASLPGARPGRQRVAPARFRPGFRTRSEQPAARRPPGLYALTAARRR